MAEVKVESVEMQSRAEDAENQRSRVQDMLDRVSKDLDEVRCVCHFIDFDVCLMHII